MYYSLGSSATSLGSQSGGQSGNNLVLNGSVLAIPADRVCRLYDHTHYICLLPRWQLHNLCVR